MSGDRTETIEKMARKMELPPPRLTLGITGHRHSNPAYEANSQRIKTVLADLFAIIETETARSGPTRLHSLMAQGTDLMAVELAIERKWEIVGPLPFGMPLNIAINAHPENAEDARALITGGEIQNSVVTSRARQIQDMAVQAQLFEMAEQDDKIAKIYLETLEDPTDQIAAEEFHAISSERASIAARVMIEHSAIIIAVWDGISSGSTGGTRHTMMQALEHNAPVIWIDANAPENWCIMTTPAALSKRDMLERDGRENSLRTLIAESTCDPRDERGGEGLESLQSKAWRKRSNPFYHGYRRIEALFGGKNSGSGFRNLRQTYETPDQVATGSAASLLSSIVELPGESPVMTRTIVDQILGRFSWADGLSTHLSDAYRGSMVMNFLLSALAIIGGITYLPLGKLAEKWPFALFEFLLLIAILGIITIGRKRRWHGRWFETRRVAEYLRHAPIMLVLGVARAPWQWPKGSEANWPEHYARNVLQEAGLPAITITTSYLRAALDDILLPHIIAQRDYHIDKAERLTATHHNLDRVSEASFVCAVLSVACFLALALTAALGGISDDIVYAVSKPFTFLGVMFPTIGGAIAGIRFFGDFERFAGISEVTASKLNQVEKRIEGLMLASDDALHFKLVADLVHSVDEIVVDEIENWQAVFGGKQITVPV